MKINVKSWTFLETQLHQDLFDSLWLEDLFGFRSQSRIIDESEEVRVVEAELRPGVRLRWSGRRGDGLRPLRDIGELSIERGQQRRACSLMDVANQLQDAIWWRGARDRFARYLDLAAKQCHELELAEASIVEALEANPDSLLTWERLTSLKDRPFHPLARAKDWGGAAFPAAPESGECFKLRWIAVPHAQLLTGSQPASPLVAELLNEQEQAALLAEVEQRSIDPSSHALIPLHPWQLRQLRMSERSDLSECVELDIEACDVRATASMRSVIVDRNPEIHLKLSMAVVCLGATRNMPPRFLANAVKAADCLERMRKRDAWLEQHLSICDEMAWFAVRQRDSFMVEPGDIACMLRRYPRPGAGICRIPMAAMPAMLSDRRLPALERVLGRNASAAQAWTWFGDVAAMLIDLGLRCLAFGVMPELHGQNVLIDFSGTKPTGIVLRDIDSMRTCPDLIREQRIPDLQYWLDRGKPQTLELASVEQLLVYFQTLLIEVNLYAVIAAIADRYDEPETDGWGILQRIVRSRLQAVPLSAGIRQQAQYALLEAEDWPFKRLIAPLLEKPQLGVGMPSSIGRIENPLRVRGRHADVA